MMTEAEIKTLRKADGAKGTSLNTRHLTQEQLQALAELQAFGYVTVGPQKLDREGNPMNEITLTKKGKLMAEKLRLPA